MFGFVCSRSHALSSIKRTKSTLSIHNRDMKYGFYGHGRSFIIFTEANCQHASVLPRESYDPATARGTRRQRRSVYILDRFSCSVLFFLFYHRRRPLAMLESSGLIKPTQWRPRLYFSFRVRKFPNKRKEEQKKNSKSSLQRLDTRISSITVCVLHAVRVIL